MADAAPAHRRTTGPYVALGAGVVALLLGLTLAMQKPTVDLTLGIALPLPAATSKHTPALCFACASDWRA